jgi:hypothetical protein
MAQPTPQAPAGGLPIYRIILDPIPNHLYNPRHPVPQRGAFHDRREAWCGMRWTRRCRHAPWRMDERRSSPAKPFGGEGRLRTAKSCGPDARIAGVKSAELSAGDGVKKLRFTRESAIYAVKPLRGEGRSVSAEPVCSCAFLLMHIAHETAGAARTRSSPRPLLRGACALCLKREQTICKTRAKVCRENAKVCLVVPASEPGPISAGAVHRRRRPHCIIRDAVWVPARRPGRR